MKIIKNKLLKKENFAKSKNTVWSTLLTLAVVLFGFLNVSKVFAQSTGSNPVSNLLLICTTRSTPCGWQDLINLINAMVQYAIELIGIVFVIVLLYAGMMYITSGGDASKVKKAKDMLYKVVWGMVYTLCAWIIVYFILTSLGVDQTFYEKII
ncbi:MAG: hypothetical protein WCQ00_03570 [bacterium]